MLVVKAACAVVGGRYFYRGAVLPAAFEGPDAERLLREGFLVRQEPVTDPVEDEAKPANRRSSKK